MSTEENEKKESRPRKIARSASTAERPAFKPTDAVDGAPETPEVSLPAASDAPPAEGVKSERRWDVRAERPAGGPPSRPRPQRRRFGGDPELPSRRPGASGGRAMPELPNRGVADRASPEFVDRWLSQKPRPRPEPGARPDRPFGDRPGRERRPHGARGEDGASARPQGARPAPPPRVPPKEEKKLPTLSETLLVGLPKVAAQGHQRDKSANKPKTAKEALIAKAQAAPPKVAKPAPEKLATKGKIVLEPAWLSAGAEGASKALKEAGADAEALVDAWTQDNNAAAIVEAANDETIPGGARKAAKRAIQVLRARNVAIPERAAAKASQPTAEEVIEATFTPPDSRGTTSFTIARRRGGDRAHIAEVIVRDEVGVIHAVSGWMSRSQIKEAHQRVADSSGMPPVAVPLEWVRARIAEAKKLNATSQVLLPLGLEKCKELIEPSPSTEPAHPTAELEATLGEDASSVGSANLHGEPELRSWLPDARALDELLRKVGGAMAPDEAKDSAKVDAVLQEEMKAATDRFFTPEVRTTVARRLRDAAMSVRQRSGDEKAKELLRVARAVERAGLITSPPHEVEFLLAFFQKGIAVLAQQSGGQLRVPVSQSA